MTVACLVIAAIALVAALVSLWGGRVTSRSLVATEAVQQKRTLNLEQVLYELAARCENLEHQAARVEEEANRRLADAETRLEGEMASCQDATLTAVAAEKASRQLLVTDVGELRQTLEAEFAAVRTEFQTERSTLARQMDAGLAQVQDALATEVAVQVAALGEAVELHQA